jgi:hypothetical protein
MPSLKAVMRCLDIDTGRNLSVLGDFFGYVRRRVPTDPAATASVSVKTQIRRVQQRHLHLNVIRVGFDTLTGTTRDRRNERIDYAIYRTQNIYATVNLGVGRVLHWVIDSADADGLDDLGGPDEADELVERATVDNDGVDCFVVRNISDNSFIGKASAIPGSCDKGSKSDGIVAGESGLGDETFAKTFAHELGHHLGLSHNHGANCPASVSAQDNLMAQSRCAAGAGEAGQRAAVLVTTGQGSTMRGHCATKSAC